MNYCKIYDGQLSRYIAAGGPCKPSVERDAASEKITFSSPFVESDGSTFYITHARVAGLGDVHELALNHI
jgi:hypothetical protein